MTSIDSGLGLTHRQAAEGADRTLLLRCMLLVAVFAAAIMMRHVVVANTDVSWLLIAGERWLDGQRLYADIVETNPPMAVLVYVPGILIARTLGTPVEIAVDGLVFAAIAFALGISALILRRSSVLATQQRWPFAMVAVAVLALLPAQTFGQREHIAFIELLPAIAVLAQRMTRETPAVWAVAMAGIGLGLAMSFKPHFALPVLCCLAVAALRLKSWRLFFAPENVVAAAMVIAYSACTFVFFPEYFTAIVPLLRDVYSIGIPLSVMLAKPVVPLWTLILVGTVLAKRDRAFDPALILLITASLGFGVVYFVQRKGWPYHSYPMMAFALLAFGYAMMPRDGFAAAGRRWAAGMALAFMALLAAAAIWFNMALDARPLQEAVARLGLQHPTIFAISGNPAIAHPLARALGGIWASRQQSLLVASYDHYLRGNRAPDQRTLAVLDGYLRREREGVVEDFRTYRPKVVLLDNASDHWEGWIGDSPELVDLLKDYRLSDSIADVDVYVRRGD